MSIFAGKKFLRCCPKCRSNSMRLYESYENSVVLEVKDGVMPKEAIDHVDGRILGVDAECTKCGHWWGLRGGTQLGDFVEE